jgi:hypothetical protein
MSHEGCRLEPIGKLRIGLDGVERIARAGGDDRNLKFVAVLEADTADGSTQQETARHMLRSTERHAADP